MRRFSILLAFAFAFLGWLGPARLYAAEPTVEATDSTERVLILNSGAIYRGQVVELEPRSHVILRLASGAQRRFEWRDLKRVSGPSSAGSTAGTRSRGSAEKMGTSAAGPTASPPHAPPPGDKLSEGSRQAGSVREHLNDAKNLEEDGQLAEALSHYEQAYARSPQPSVLYRMAGLHDQLNHPRQALNLYRRYMAQNPQMSEERQVEVAANIARLSLAIQDGSPSPPGSRAVDRAQPTGSELRSPGMLAAGISIWATSYLAAAIVGSVFLAGTANTQIQRTYSSSVIGQAQAAFGVLLLPVAGPFVSAGLIPTPEWTLPWLFVGGGTQVLGMALTIAGGRRRPAGSMQAQRLLLPSISPHNTGLVLAGTF